MVQMCCLWGEEGAFMKSVILPIKAGWQNQRLEGLPKLNIESYLFANCEYVFKEIYVFIYYYYFVVIALL